MKILLIGPCPPPHGGISVHVAGIYQCLQDAGIRCEKLDSTNASRPAFPAQLARYALRGWTTHLHVNGHNWTSWALALECGTAGALRGGCVLTVHSGMTPDYIARCSRLERAILTGAARLYRRIVCVSAAIRDALQTAGVSKERLEVAPAFLGSQSPRRQIDAHLAHWIEEHRPLLSTAIFFRPEYGFDVLTGAMCLLRKRYPTIGCVVMGSGEMRPQAEQTIRESGLDGNVRLLGDVDHEACLALISRSDVFVRPTLADGDSISVREAAALGVPVVASRTGTRPAGVKLFPPGDSSAMAAQIESALHCPRVQDQPAPGSMTRILEIYRQISQWEAACVPSVES